MKLSLDVRNQIKMQITDPVIADRFWAPLMKTISRASIIFNDLSNGVHM